jgi:hypothetical protein
LRIADASAAPRPGPRTARGGVGGAEGVDVTVERTAVNPVTWSLGMGFNQGEVVSGHTRAGPVLLRADRDER